MVHGTLADYRLGRLIKYSFYKNISFACMFFFFQFFNGWSGQARPAAAAPPACGAGTSEQACCDGGDAVIDWVGRPGQDVSADHGVAKAHCVAVH
jgi:hypothetical protein